MINEKRNYNKLNILIFFIFVFIFLISTISSAYTLGEIVRPKEKSIILLSPNDSDLVIQSTNDKITSLLKENNIHIKEYKFNNIDELTKITKSVSKDKIVVIVGHGSNFGLESKENIYIPWESFSGKYFERDSNFPIIFLSCFSSNINSVNGNLITFSNEIDGYAGANLVLAYSLLYLKSNTPTLRSVMTSLITEAYIEQEIMKYPLAVYNYAYIGTDEGLLDIKVGQDWANLYQLNLDFTEFGLKLFDELDVSDPNLNCTQAWLALHPEETFCEREVLNGVLNDPPNEPIPVVTGVYLLLNLKASEEDIAALLTALIAEKFDVLTGTDNPAQKYGNLNLEVFTLSLNHDPIALLSLAVDWVINYFQSNWLILLILVISIIVIWYTGGLFYEADELSLSCIAFLLPLGFSSNAISDTQNLTTDHDGDLLTKNVEEAILGTSDSNRDSDGDGMVLNDYNEIFLFGTNPASSDTDADSLTDYNELCVYGTYPISTDTDGDGLTDNSEIFTYHTSPTVVDTDGDSLSDYQELFTYVTNPLIADTDGDGYNDGFEVNVIWNNPTAALDPQSPVYTFLWKTYSYTNYKFYAEVYNHFADSVKVYWKNHASGTYYYLGSSWYTFPYSNFLMDRIGTLDFSAYAYSQIDVKVEWWKNGAMYTSSQITLTNYVPPPPGGGCVAKNTYILMTNGVDSIKVQNLKVGDWVLGYDTMLGAKVPVQVTDITNTKVDSLIDINNGLLKVTLYDQPIWVRSSTIFGWVINPIDLQVGYEIYDGITNSWINITSLNIINYQNFEVFDVKTSPQNNFFANGILVDRKIQ